MSEMDEQKPRPGRKPGTPKTGGRKKGTPNKVTRLLKDDILAAAALAHPEGRIGYLTEQAQVNPTAFLTLLGKVLPADITSGGEPIQFDGVRLVPILAGEVVGTDDE